MYRYQTELFWIREARAEKHFQIKAGSKKREQSILLAPTI